MARVTRRQLVQQMEALEPAIAREFARAIANIRSQATLQLITGLIEAGRYDDVSTALGINAARFSQLAERIREVYAAGGIQGAAELPVLWSDPFALENTGATRGRRNRMRVAFQFDLRNAQAEAWLSQNAGRLINAITTDQQRLIVNVVRDGMAIGQGPRQTALDLVGRVGETGRRTGGLVGLTADQAQYVTNARTALLSGDPAQMRTYFDRKLRDQRFDGIVQRAIDAKKPVTVPDVQKIAGRYADRLLQQRGENIARTETITAFNAAREEAFRQAIASGAIAAENVDTSWGATGDGRTRHTHRAMNGQKRKFGMPFLSPSGARLMFPGDNSLGAGAEEVINCRCTKLYRVDNIAEAQRGQ